MLLWLRVFSVQPFCRNAGIRPTVSNRKLMAVTIAARAPGAVRQPLEPVGINAAGLHATALGGEISSDNDTGADHVAYRPGEFLVRCESIHRGKDAAGVFRRQSAGVLPWLAQRYRYPP